MCIYVCLYVCAYTHTHTYIYCRRKWQSTTESLPGKSHGQRSLVGCSPWGHKELGTTEWLTHTHTHTHTHTYIVQLVIDSKSSSSVLQTCNGKIESYNSELGISMVGVANWLETKNLRMFSHSKLLEKKSLLRWGKQNFFHMCFNKLDLSEIKIEIFKCHHEN